MGKNNQKIIESIVDEKYYLMFDKNEKRFGNNL